MTDEPTPPVLDRMAKARAAKAAKAKQPKTDDTMASLILDLQRQITELKSASVPMTIPDAPPPSQDNPPGTYVKVFEDKQGNTMYRKVHWTRPAVAAAYPAVTFTPNETMEILPHGVKYIVTADVEITVPSIVKDIYDVQRKQRLAEAQMYRFRPEESNEVAARAVQQFGTRQWSRVSRLGVGIDVNQQEPGEANKAG